MNQTDSMAPRYLYISGHKDEEFIGDRVCVPTDLSLTLTIGLDFHMIETFSKAMAFPIIYTIATKMPRQLMVRLVLLSIIRVS